MYPFSLICKGFRKNNVTKTRKETSICMVLLFASTSVIHKQQEKKHTRRCHLKFIALTRILSSHFHFHGWIANIYLHECRFSTGRLGTWIDQNQLHLSYIILKKIPVSRNIYQILLKPANMIEKLKHLESVWKIYWDWTGFPTYFMLVCPKVYIFLTIHSNLSLNFIYGPAGL